MNNLKTNAGAHVAHWEGAHGCQNTINGTSLARLKARQHSRPAGGATDSRGKARSDKRGACCRCYQIGTYFGTTRKTRWQLGQRKTILSGPHVETSRPRKARGKSVSSRVPGNSCGVTATISNKAREELTRIRCGQDRGQSQERQERARWAQGRKGTLAPRCHPLHHHPQGTRTTAELRREGERLPVAASLSCLLSQTQAGILSWETGSWAQPRNYLRHRNCTVSDSNCPFPRGTG